jgi:hypothetical protein
LKQSIKIKSSQWKSWKSWTMNEFEKVKQRDENELMWKYKLSLGPFKGVITFFLIVQFLDMVVRITLKLKSQKFSGFTNGSHNKFLKLSNYESY